MQQTPPSRLFPALLRYWRTRRGLSQLGLSLEADVSTKHISHLESGRARPSAEMVLTLFSVMNVPLNDQNEALAAAGFEPRFPAPPPDDLAPEVGHAIDQMMAQHEPYPLVVLLSDGTVVRQNRGARMLFGQFIHTPASMEEPPNMFTLLFDPRFMRPYIVNWPAFAQSVASRVHREHLLRGDARLESALGRIFEAPDVPKSWRQPDFSSDVPPTLQLRLARDDVHASFLVAVTTFSTPRHVTLDELRIESCFPLDAATRATCARLAA